MKTIKKNIAHPSRTCCKHSKPLPYYMQKQQDAPALEATQHHRPAQPPSLVQNCFILMIFKETSVELSTFAIILKSFNPLCKFKHPFWNSGSTFEYNSLFKDV